MLEIFTSWINSSVEFQNWGWNATTIGAVGIVVFTFIEGYGVWRQNQSIWQQRSGASVSVIWFSYVLFYFMAFALYGFFTESLSIIFNGLVYVMLTTPILIGLWKFKGFTFWEIASFFFCLAMVPAMAFLPWKGQVFLAISLVSIFATASEPWEIWKKKHAGVVDIWLLSMLLAGNCFWSIFALSTRDFYLLASSLLGIGLLAMTISLWMKYPKGTEMMAKQE